jgi:hypothetical protein
MSSLGGDALPPPNARLPNHRCPPERFLQGSSYQRAAELILANARVQRRPIAVARLSIDQAPGQSFTGGGAR